MGSPPEEAGQIATANEGPQLSMQIRGGFWLFDTPCTQELWEAVMEETPSHFHSPTRPVVLVSWDNVQAFLKRLNGQLEGLELSLPSEAQWEYACRAGTKSATYAGDMEILGENSAPLLDKIAWYGGNCGIDYELADGFDTTSWPEKQYDFKWGGTHPVGCKTPNAWGLYDMLGNVWEWCRDEHRADPQVLTNTVTMTSQRIIRGGAWIVPARYVRAAARDWLDHDIRANYLGFRCGEFRTGELSQG